MEENAATISDEMENEHGSLTLGTSESNESIALMDLKERADNLSDKIKKLSVAEDSSERSSSVNDEDVTITVVESKQRIDEKDGSVEEDKEREDVNNVSVSESLVVVNKILSDIDQDLDNHLTEEGIPEVVDNASRGGQPEKNFSFDSLREEKSKKSISFSLPEERRKSDSSVDDNDDALMDDVHSISSEATVTDNIHNILSHETHPDVEAQRAKIEMKAKILLGGIGRVTKQKYFDDRDGRKDGPRNLRAKETEAHKFPIFDQKTVFKYPDVYRPEFSKGRHFWQMPFREKLYHETLNPTEADNSDSEDEDCKTDKEEEQSIPDQNDLDPMDFAPTGDIYSYFHRRRMDPFRFSNPLNNTVRNTCGGRQGKLYVF